MTLNPLAALTPYDFRHLADHLVNGGRATDLHHLLALEYVADDGDRKENAWFSAKSLQQDTDGFIHDVRRAWDAAEGLAGRGSDSSSQAESAGLQFRYALIVASMAGLASDIPPALMASFVENGVWSQDEALAQVRLRPAGIQRVTALSTLIPALDERLRSSIAEETLDEVRSLESAADRATLSARLASFVPAGRLGEVVDAAVADVQLLGYWRQQVEILTSILAASSAELDHDRQRHILAVALAADKPIRSELVQPLVPFLAGAVLGELVARAEAGWEDSPTDAHREEGESLAGFRSLAAARLASIGQTGDALAVVASIEGNIGLWTRTAASLMPFLALDEARALSTRVLHRVGITSGARSARAMRRSRTVESFDDEAAGLRAKLAVRLSQLGQTEEGLAEVRTIDVQWGHRPQALADMLPYLDEPLHQEVAREALRLARRFIGTHQRSADLSATRPDTLRCRVVLITAPYLTARALSIAVKMARTHPYMNERWRMVSALATRLSERDRMRVVTALRRELAVQRSLLVGVDPQVLADIAKLLPSTDAVDILRDSLPTTLKDDARQVAAVADLVPFLPDDQLPIAATFLRQLTDRRTAGGTRAKLTESGSVDPPDEVGEWGSELKARIALRLARRDPAQALESIAAVAHERSRIDALRQVLPDLPDQLIANAIEIARTATFDRSRVEALVACAGRAMSPRREALLKEALALAWPIHEWGDRVGSLPRLAPHLSTALMRDALGEIEAMIDGPRGFDTTAFLGCVPSKSLVALAPYLPIDLVEFALRSARRLPPVVGSPAIASLGSRFPTPAREQVLSEAVQLVVPGDGSRWVDGGIYSLSEIVNYLPAPMVRSLLEAEPVRALRYEGLFAAAAASLVEAGAIEEGVDIAITIENDVIMRELVSRIAPLLDPMSIHRLVSVVSGGIRSEDAVADLASQLARVGAVEEARTLVYGIPSSNQGYRARARALINIASQTVESDDAVDALVEGFEALWTAVDATNGTFSSLDGEVLYSAALNVRLNQLSAASVSNLLGVTLHLLSRRTRRDLLDCSKIIFACVGNLAGESAAVVSFSALRDIGRWWT